MYAGCKVGVLRFSAFSGTVFGVHVCVRNYVHMFDVYMHKGACVYIYNHIYTT